MTAALFAGCGSACSGNRGDAAPDAANEAEDRIQVEGTLTAEGVECQALRTAQTELFTLTGELGGFGVGDRVRVEGRLARFSTCMQGTTLAVERIDPVE